MTKNEISPIFFFFGVWIIFGILFNFAVTNMASTYIVSDLGGSNDIASYTVSFFGLGNTVTIPLALSLGDRIGKKRLLHYCMVSFFVISFFSTFSTNYPIFNTFRFLQGCASGPIFILIAFFISTFGNKKQKSQFIKYVLASFILAPTMAAGWGGTIAYFLTWRWIFYIDVLLLLLSCLFLWFQLEKLPEEAERKPFDIVGYISFAIAMFSLGFFAIMAQELDYFRSDLLCFFALTFLISFPFFLIWTLLHPYPIFELRFLKNLRLLFSLLQLAFLFSSYFGMVTLFSLWLKLDVNYTLLWISAILFATTLSAFVLMVIMNRFEGIDRRICLALSILLLAISCFYTMYFNVEINLGRIAFSRILAGIALALFLHPLLHMTVETVEEEHRVRVLVLFQLFRAFPSTLGTAFYTTLWWRRFVFFHERLGESLNDFSPLTKAFFQRATTFHLHPMQHLTELNHFLDRQAKSLALNDVFYFMGLLLLLLFFSVLATFSLRSIERPFFKKSIHLDNA